VTRIEPFYRKRVLAHTVPQLAKALGVSVSALMGQL